VAVVRLGQAQAFLAVVATGHYRGLLALDLAGGSPSEAPTLGVLWIDLVERH
jgi:hypothetical protein